MQKFSYMMAFSYTTFFESIQFKNAASFLAYSFPVLAFRMLFNLIH